MKNETNAERFVRIAESRVNQVALALEKLADMPSRTFYEYTPEQTERIFDYLREKLSETEKAFAEKDSRRFSLAGEKEGGKPHVS